MSGMNYRIDTLKRELVIWKIKARYFPQNIKHFFLYGKKMQRKKIQKLQRGGNLFNRNLRHHR